MIRQFHVRDLGHVSRMDQDWSLEAYSAYLDYEGYTGRVLTINNRVVGAMMYRYTRTRFMLHRLVIAELHRRQKHGRELVNYLKFELQPDRKNSIVAHVGEYDLRSQLFLRACGFRWRMTADGFYRMEFALVTPDTVWHPVNRVAEFAGRV